MTSRTTLALVMRWPSRVTTPVTELPPRAASAAAGRSARQRAVATTTVDARRRTGARVPLMCQNLVLRVANKMAERSWNQVQDPLRLGDELHRNSSRATLGAPAYLLLIGTGSTGHRCRRRRV